MSGIETVAEMMEIAAITAPKAQGKNFIVVKTLLGDDLKRIHDWMVQYAEVQKIPGFARDGKNVLNSGALVLIGMKDADVADLNCAACGSEACLVINTVEGEFQGPQCALRILDMGIALGSAVKTAGMMNVDNRIMYRAGVAARQTGMIDADFVMGIPLSVSGKSIFFDR
ncbi:MAG: DUF2148 domain-containing protein [Anaerolineales bacterium]|nr:DUF2148 domain-containing protein [Anaerolineales bacterium]